MTKAGFINRKRLASLLIKPAGAAVQKKRGYQPEPEKNYFHQSYKRFFQQASLFFQELIKNLETDETSSKKRMKRIYYHKNLFEG